MDRTLKISALVALAVGGPPVHWAISPSSPQSQPRLVCYAKGQVPAREADYAKRNPDIRQIRETEDLALLSAAQLPTGFLFTIGPIPNKHGIDCDQTVNVNRPPNYNWGAGSRDWFFVPNQSDTAIYQPTWYAAAENPIHEYDGTRDPVLEHSYVLTRKGMADNLQKGEKGTSVVGFGTPDLGANSTIHCPVDSSSRYSNSDMPLKALSEQAIRELTGRINADKITFSFQGAGYITGVNLKELHGPRNPRTINPCNPIQGRAPGG